MYNEDLDAYLLTYEQYTQLSSYEDGWEDGGMEGDYYVVSIFSDDILAALNLGAYHGGQIDINGSHQGGPM